VQEERSCRARKGRGGGGGCADPGPRRAARGPRGPAPLPGAPDDAPDVSAVRHGARCVREAEGSRGQTCVVLYLGVVIGAWVIIELLVSDALLQVQRPPPAARRPRAASAPPLIPASQSRLFSRCAVPSWRRALDFSSDCGRLQRLGAPFSLASRRRKAPLRAAAAQRPKPSGPNPSGRAFLQSSNCPAADVCVTRSFRR
jgi:hypothetical protein